MKMRDFTYNIIDKIVVVLDEEGNDDGNMPLEEGWEVYEKGRRNA